MNVSALGIVSLFLAQVLGCGHPEGKQMLDSQRESPIHKVDDRSKNAILSVLDASGRSAILEVKGRCLDSRTISYSLELTPLQNLKGETDSNLRDLLSRNPNMHVQKGNSGIFTISSDDVSHDLLSVQMKHVKLSIEEQYNPMDAFLAVLSTPEVANHMKQQNITLASQLDGLRSVPASENPHVGANFENLTVAEFEERILKTFPGLIVYQECSLKDGGKLVSFEFNNVRAR